jgi:hypothetical protein
LEIQTKTKFQEFDCFFEVEMIGKKEPEWAGKKCAYVDKGEWVVWKNI